MYTRTSMWIVHLTCIVAVFLVGGLGFLAAATSLRSWPTLRPNDGLTLGTLEKETVNNYYEYRHICIHYCSYLVKSKSTAYFSIHTTTSLHAWLHLYMCAFSQQHWASKTSLACMLMAL